MDIGLNWNEWHQEAARKPYVRVGVTLLSGALILMSAQEIVSLYLEKNLISEIEVCATTEDINVSGNDLPEKVTITKQINSFSKSLGSPSALGDDHLGATTAETTPELLVVQLDLRVVGDTVVVVPRHGRHVSGETGEESGGRSRHRLHMGHKR